MHGIPPILLALAAGVLAGGQIFPMESQTISAGNSRAEVSVARDGDLRAYQFTTDAELRADKPPGKTIRVAEVSGQALARTGSPVFDGLHAMAVAEALENSVSRISDGSYNNDAAIPVDAFQTGELWKYVWTRDLAYSLDLALAGFDPARAASSLLFKASDRKPAAAGGVAQQIIQDTGSGGSYPVSTDRVVWALGARATLKHLDGTARDRFLHEIAPILEGTIEQDRALAFDPATGLYRGEQSFLDWREQTYPGWTKENVVAIAASKSLSVNAAMVGILETAAECAQALGRPEQAAHHMKSARDLRAAINRHFFDSSTGLYRTYLISDDGSRDMKLARHDLLGLSLAILLGIADHDRARTIIAAYPTGPFGPPVVWPQEKSVDIYHNQGIWPFVTAYWIKAARAAGNADAVDAGIRSLTRQAAANLSNMENFDFVTGRADVREGPRKGPVVNSRRQLWSVAGYLSMVRDVVFGLETTMDGIRFNPFVTAGLRNDLFPASDVIELRDLAYRNTRHRVRIHLPPARSFPSGSCDVEKILLNGKPIGSGFVARESLAPENDWEIFLVPPPDDQDPGSLRVADVSDERAIFGPAAPEWLGTGRGGLTAESGHTVLHFRHPDPDAVTFTVFRDGAVAARGVRSTTWTDPEPAGNPAIHSYAVAAVDSRSGNESHVSQSRSLREPSVVIPAKDMQNKGGNLVASHHFENWGGRPDDELVTPAFRATRSGPHDIRAEFSNGSGPVNTGITCAVKRLDVRNARGETVASGYLVMPQSGSWTRWDFSAPLPADLREGEDYTIRIAEDGYSRNMSFLEKNKPYTGGVGGGNNPHNFANIASLEVLPAPGRSEDCFYK